MDSSPKFFFCFFNIYQSVLAVVLSKTKLAYSSISIFFSTEIGDECLYCVSIAFLKEMPTSFKSEI